MWRWPHCAPAPCSFLLAAGSFLCRSNRNGRFFVTSVHQALLSLGRWKVLGSQSLFSQRGEKEGPEFRHGEGHPTLPCRRPPPSSFLPMGHMSRSLTPGHTAQAAHLCSSFRKSSSCPGESPLWGLCQGRSLQLHWAPSLHFRPEQRTGAG